MKADLYTLSKELEEDILTDFNGLIFPEQHQVDDSESGRKIYCFFDLDYLELVKFLSKYREKYEFEIRDKNGEFLEINQVKRRVESLNWNFN